MKATSLWQPYPSLIACGVKPYETRDFAPPRAYLGQRIAIHAAKRIERPYVEFVTEMFEGQHEEGGLELAEKLKSLPAAPAELAGMFGKWALPVGCVVCTAVLEAAFQVGEPAKDTARPAATVVQRFISRPFPECFTVRYDDFGDYSPGRWAWLLRDAKPLRPFAWKGKQGYFDVPDDMIAAAGGLNG